MKRFAVIAAAILLAGCGDGREATPAAVAKPSLATALVELRDIELTWSSEALVEAVRQSTVSAQIAGRVIDIRFDVGDRVKKGEVKRAIVVRVSRCRRDTISVRRSPRCGAHFPL